MSHNIVSKFKQNENAMKEFLFRVYFNISTEDNWDSFAGDGTGHG